jgi:6-phosphogluconolactonase
MKFGKVGQVVLVSAIALVVATLFTACSTLTVGFLFVATTKQTPGQIEVYEVNSESGAAYHSHFALSFRRQKSYRRSCRPELQEPLCANEDDNNIVQFGIGTDGKLYPQSTVNTPGSFRYGRRDQSAGTFLYVVDTLQPVAGMHPDESLPRR